MKGGNLKNNLQLWKRHKMNGKSGKDNQLVKLVKQESMKPGMVPEWSEEE